MKYRVLCICALAVLLLALTACSRNSAPAKGGLVSSPPAAVSQQDGDGDSGDDDVPGGGVGNGGTDGQNGEEADGEHRFAVKLPFVNDVFVRDTWVSPAGGGPALAVHIARSIGDETIPLYRQYAIVVDPATREQTIYSLTDAYVRDSYNVDSVARAYGFIDDRRLLYVAAVGDDPVGGAFTYRIATLDIRTGDVATIIQELPGAPMDEFFVPGWLVADSKELVLNTHQSGLMWRIDIERQTAELTENRYPHEWPFFLTVPSPDGERLWYTDVHNRSYKLYELDGKLLTEFPFIDGFDQYQPFMWSPDGQYATFAYTDDRDRKHVIAEHEVYEAATQHIRIYDRQGKLVRTISADGAKGDYVEPAGWLPGGELLLRHYKLDRSGERPVKTGFSFELLAVSGGTLTALELVDAPEALTNAAPAYDKRLRALSWIDAQARTVWQTSDGSTVLLSSPDADNVHWVENTYGDGEANNYSTLRAYNRTADAWSSLQPDRLIDYSPVLVGDSWITGNDLYYTAVQP